MLFLLVFFYLLAVLSVNAQDDNSVRRTMLFSDDELRDGAFGNRQSSTEICEQILNDLFVNHNCSGTVAFLYYRGDSVVYFPQNYSLNATHYVSGPTGVRIADSWAELTDAATPWKNELAYAQVTNYKNWLGSKKRCEEWSTNKQCKNGGVYYSDPNMFQEDQDSCGTYRSLLCVGLNCIAIGTPGPTTARPSLAPTTAQPTKTPTAFPTVSPSLVPSQSPTTSQPTTQPTTTKPSAHPSTTPTTSNPTKTPSRAPSHTPTHSPTTEWTQLSKLDTPNQPSMLGYCISISDAGDRLIAGAPAFGSNKGAFYSFTKSPTGTWSYETGAMQHPSLSPTAGHGTACALSAAGDLAVVGGNNGVATYIRNATGWFVSGDLLTASSNSFGNAVALNEAGTYLCVGDFNAGTSGEIRCYRRTGSTWTVSGSTLTCSGLSSGQHLGVSVALSNNGNKLIAGANLGNKFCSYDCGSVIGCTQSPSSAFSMPGDAIGNPLFGNSVAFSGGFNSYIAVGGPYDNTDKGAVWIYSYNGVSFDYVHKITPPPTVGTSPIGFGQSVAFSRNSNILVVGIYSENSDVGSIATYERTGSFPSTYTLLVQTSGAFAIGAGRQGYSVAADNTGAIVAWGAPYDNTFRGAVYVSGRTTTGPTQSPITSLPSKAPSKTPTTSLPSTTPTTSTPSQTPSHVPSKSPTTSHPSTSPTTSLPSQTPSHVPSTGPTSSNPSRTPSFNPTQSPTTSAPTRNPTKNFPIAGYKFPAPTDDVLVQEFGRSVSITEDGYMLAVGAPRADGDIGWVYVLRRDMDQWVTDGVLVHVSSVSGDRMGGQVKISDNGRMVLTNDQQNNFATFRYVGGVWTPDASLLSVPNTEKFDMNGPGNFACFGIPDKNMVRCFKYSGGAWTQAGANITSPLLRPTTKSPTTEGADTPPPTLPTSSPTVGSEGYFGISVSLNTDGTRLVVGAMGEYLGNGRVYTYTCDVNTGCVDSPVPVVVQAGEAANGTILFPPTGGSVLGVYPLFGSSLTISGDGQIMAAVGLTDAADASSVWLYSWTGTRWDCFDHLANLVLPKEGFFAESLALSTVGDTLLVGHRESVSATGSVLIYKRMSGGRFELIQQNIGPDAIGEAREGTSVTMDGTGTRFVWGGPGDDSDQGAIWTSPYFTFSPTTAGPSKQPTVSNPSRTPSFVPTRTPSTTPSRTPSASPVIPWEQSASLAYPGAPLDAAMSGDGNNVLIASSTSDPVLYAYGGSGGGGGARRRRLLEETWELDAYPFGTDEDVRGSQFHINHYGNRALACSTSGDGEVKVASIGTDGLWTHLMLPLPADVTLDQAYGRTCSLSGDGNTVAVSNVEDDDYVGAVHTFRFDGSNWNDMAPKMVGGMDIPAGLMQGYAISLSFDGNRVAFCSQLGDEFNAVWIFEFSGSAWVESIRFPASGEAVTMSPDGNVVAFKSFTDITEIIVLTRIGGSWSFSTLIPSSIVISSFGNTLRLSSDGTYLAACELFPNSQCFVLRRLMDDSYEAASEMRSAPGTSGYAASLSAAGGRLMLAGETSVVIFFEQHLTSSPTTGRPSTSPTSSSPSAGPSRTPSKSPTKPPTNTPSQSPSRAPSKTPTVSAPTGSPTTSAPTTSPIQPWTVNSQTKFNGLGLVNQERYGSGQSLSGDGMTWAVSSNGKSNQGAVQVYVRSPINGAWSLQTSLNQLVGNLPVNGTFAAPGIRLTRDGSMLAFGSSTGKTWWWFTRSPEGVWSQYGLQHNETTDNQYGYRIVFNENATFICVPAISANSIRGAVQCLNRTEQTHTISVAKFMGSSISTGWAMGQSMDMSKDGTKLMIGSQANFLWFYSCVPGISCTEVQTFSHGAYDVTMDDSGTYVVLGSPNLNANNGSAYVYKYNGTRYNLFQTIPPPSTVTATSYFGEVSKLSGNGLVLAVAATRDTAGKGAVIIYEWSASDNQFVYSAKIVPTGYGNNNRVATLEFDYTGSTLVVCSIMENSNAGACYILHRYPFSPPAAAPTINYIYPVSNTTQVLGGVTGWQTSCNTANVNYPSCVSAKPFGSYRNGANPTHLKDQLVSGAKVYSAYGELQASNPVAYLASPANSIREITGFSSFLSFTNSSGMLDTTAHCSNVTNSAQYTLPTFNARLGSGSSISASWFSGSTTTCDQTNYLVCTCNGVRGQSSSFQTTVRRYVSVEHIGYQQFIALSLSSIRVYGVNDTVTDIAAGKPVTLSSVQLAGSLITDGTGFTYGATDKQMNPWVSVDLGYVGEIAKITVVMPITCCGDQAVGAFVTIREGSPRGSIAWRRQIGSALPGYDFSFPVSVMIGFMDGTVGVISIKEVQITTWGKSQGINILTATLSSTDGSQTAGLAIDGDLGTFAQTTSEANAFLNMTLGEVGRLRQIKITNGDVQTQLVGAYITVTVGFEGDSTIVWQRQITSPQATYTFEILDVGAVATAAPSASPTTSPTSSAPSKAPSGTPSKTPTTSLPTASPTTSLPTTSPTTSAPSKAPSTSPSKSPTTSRPSQSPSKTPSKSPTTSAPSKTPTWAPAASWTAVSENKLVGSGGPSGEQQGFYAAMSGDGMYFAQSTGVGPATSQGSFYVYARNPSTFAWAQMGASYLQGSPQELAAVQGSGIRINRNGTVIVFGTSTATKWWLFTRSGTTWSQFAGSAVSNFVTGYGTKVVMDDGGTFVCVTAPGSASNTGSMYCYSRGASSFTQVGSTFVGTGAVAGTNFGQAIDMSKDGTKIIVAGYGYNSVGALWYYSCVPRTSCTMTQGPISPTGAVGNPSMGRQIAMDDLGTYVIAGGRQDNSNEGAVWVFKFNGSTYSQLQKITPPPSVSAGSFLGTNVDISGDGRVLALGAARDNSNQGAVLMYQLDFATDQYVYLSKIVPTGYTGTTQFGFTELDYKGETLLVCSAVDASNKGACSVFSRYAFTKSPTTP